MNENTSFSNEIAAPAGGRGDRRFQWLALAFAVTTLLLIAEWWSFRTQMHKLRAEVAERLQAGDAINSETKTLMKSAQESMRELQSKVSVLENKQAEAQSQQVALEQLYQDMSKNRDDWALSEIEQVLSTASQQLQLAGNVQGALIALQNADNRLSRSDKAQFITIRRAIAHDIARLKALPEADIAGITLRLDGVVDQVDNMPLLSDEKPSLPVAPPKKSHQTEKKSGPPVADTANSKPSKGGEWLAVLGDRWDSWSGEMWSEIRQLIRVRDVKTPDALLLSPTQAYYARENLKLHLMNARLALLSRNEFAFRNDLVSAQDEIAKYFDTHARQTQIALALLKQSQNSNLSIEMPTLAESLNAVRNYKTRP